jgi:hypothetical protein
MLSRETNFHRRRLFWPQFTQYCRIRRATLWERFSPNELNGWTGLPWMKAITINSLNICIFSFVSFSSVAVMLIPRGTPSISLSRGWSKSPCGIYLSPPALKIQAFSHNMINYNICQMKYWHCVRNQFSGLSYRRRFRTDIDFRRASWTLSSDPWFAINCCTNNRTGWSRPNLASSSATVLSVSVQWIHGPLAFGAGAHRWKTRSEPEYPPVTVFQMQFQVIWIEIHTLDVRRSPRTCSFQRLQFYIFYTKWVWDSSLRNECHTSYPLSWRRKELRFSRNVGGSRTTRTITKNVLLQEMTVEFTGIIITADNGQ